MTALTAPFGCSDPVAAESLWCFDTWQSTASYPRVLLLEPYSAMGAGGRRGGCAGVGEHVAQEEAQKEVAVEVVRVVEVVEVGEVCVWCGCTMGVARTM